MKLSKIVFLMGLATLGLSSLLTWQRSAEGGYAKRSNAIVPVSQNSLTTAFSAEAAPQSRSAAAIEGAAPPIAPAPTAPSMTPIASTVPTAPARSAGAQRQAIAPAFSPPAIAQSKVQRITACNGQLGNANFRSAPSLLSEAVLGVVARGQLVQLTGRTVVNAEIVWHEAIAPAPLYPSPDRAAINQLGAGQTGWIAGCFVGG
ncbi:hypothetical protein [Leptolyngbya sp. FACHB-711]|uniref:hypothetical protein n=1 Tax=Leptolyngbya sp. FACHB-711 TaxID=2692813 RepID=UPI0016863A58|nr:hypothetical protein [Leptolyngbya sp. FACHB-711]MBD2024202.1 hypothetical protein [Leptolyngbya sp. FACHB-711]